MTENAGIMLRGFVASWLRGFVASWLRGCLRTKSLILLVPTLQRGNATLVAPAARLGDAGASRPAPTPERGSQMKSVVFLIKNQIVVVSEVIK